MRKLMRKLMTILFLVFLCAVGFAAETSKKIPAHSRIYIAPMDGFENDLKAAMETKKVPLEIVAARDQADFEISGTAESQKASTAKKVILWNWHSNEQASIRVSDLKSGEIVFAYSVNKQSSAHGRRSTAEACAKHLKEQVQDQTQPAKNNK